MLSLDGFVPVLVIGAAAALLVAGRHVYGQQSATRSQWAEAAAILVLVSLTVLMEHQMGRALVYSNGPVRFWSGDISSDQNSQQFADPYSFTHLSHGAIFYGVTKAVLPTASVGLRAMLTVALEAAWEVHENTDTVIERYRSETISLGYYGDSVLNSVADILACGLGFLLARLLPVPATVAWVMAVEVILGFWIRDNLALNVLMLLYPIDAVRVWQSGG